MHYTMDTKGCGCTHSTSSVKLLKHVILLCFIIILQTHVISGRKHNDPPYHYVYLEDDCQPYHYANDTGTNWDKRIHNISGGDHPLYGYVQPTRDDVYRGPFNCAIKVVAPEGYKLVVRIPRVEVFHDVTECVVDYMSVIGATNELKYCGFGTVTHSIYSTSNWLIFKLLASDWSASHDYIGFVLYYTAVHYDICDTEGPNATEWKCGGMDWCTPREVTCDTRDNCGGWEDEKASLCGLTDGAIVAISVVSILVGGTAIFFIIYCLYNKQKQKKARQRQHAIQPDRVYMPSVYHGGAPMGMTTVPPTLSGNGAMAEPPPPYTPLAFINMAYAGEMTNQGQPPADAFNPYNEIPDSGTTQANGTANGIAAPVGPDGAMALGGSANINVRYTTATNMRSTIGEPPPVYSMPATDGVTDAAAAPPTAEGGVSFEALPAKEDDKNTNK